MKNTNEPPEEVIEEAQAEIDREAEEWLAAVEEEIRKEDQADY